MLVESKPESMFIMDPKGFSFVLLPYKYRPEKCLDFQQHLFTLMNGWCCITHRVEGRVIAVLLWSMWI